MPESQPRQPRDADIAPEKSLIRREIRQTLAEIAPQQRLEKSSLICRAITSHSAWLSARTIATFAPLASEPDLDLLWPNTHSKTLCYPRVHPAGLDLIPVRSLTDLIPGKWGLREPPTNSSEPIDPTELNLILVPGIAFTPDGHRLGRGGGFYDRLLATPSLRAVKIGVCYSAQLRPDLPVEPHDQRVDLVITEDGPT